MAELSAREQEMFNDIVDLQLKSLKKDIQKGWCPYKIHPVEALATMSINCYETNCDECQRLWVVYKRKEIVAYYRKKYGLKA